MSDSSRPVSDDDPIRARIAKAVRDVREQTPLAQSFTNFVTINLVANAQLAIGGTAAMGYLPDDIVDTASIAKASYINVGTLLPFYRDALPQIARGFHKAGHPWVLDPVAAGIGATRTEILNAFRFTPPTVVRANASEVLALTGLWGLDRDEADGGDVPDASGNAPAPDRHRPAGVEAVDDVDSAAGAAIRLARSLAVTAPGGPGRSGRVRSGRSGDRRRAHVPPARRQPADDQDHRRGLLAWRRDGYVSGRHRPADGGPDGERAVQPCGRDRRRTRARPWLVPDGAARRPVEHHRGERGRQPDPHGIGHSKISQDFQTSNKEHR